jgi:ribosomal-protein-alanine N-acetyltransferase
MQNDSAQPKISTDRLIIRMADPGDIPAIIDYLKSNDAHLSPFNPPKPDGLFTDTYWHERLLIQQEEFKSGRTIRLCAFSVEGASEVVGTLELSQIIRGPFQACYLGYGIAKKHEGKGLMSEAVCGVISYAFEELNIHRIMANHLPSNERSASLLKRLGFVREGLAKDYLFIGGAWRDHVLNSLTNSNWKVS